MATYTEKISFIALLELISLHTDKRAHHSLIARAVNNTRSKKVKVITKVAWMHVQIFGLSALVTTKIIIQSEIGKIEIK